MRMMGGITRLKYHLAKISRHEVDICPNSTPEIMRISNKVLEDMGLAREYMEAMKAQFARGGGGIFEEGSSAASIPPSTSSFFVPRTKPSAQPSIRSMVNKRRRKRLISWWVSVSYGVTFLLTLPRQTHSINQCLM
jgi:hypothetical protein